MILGLIYYTFRESGYLTTIEFGEQVWLDMRDPRHVARWNAIVETTLQQARENEAPPMAPMQNTAFS